MAWYDNIAKAVTRPPPGEDQIAWDYVAMRRIALARYGAVHGHPATPRAAQLGILRTLSDTVERAGGRWFGWTPAGELLAKSSRWYRANLLEEAAALPSERFWAVARSYALEYDSRRQADPDFLDELAAAARDRLDDIRDALERGRRALKKAEDLLEMLPVVALGIGLFLLLRK